MRNFLIQGIKFWILVLILFESIVRIGKLTNDVPQRTLDRYGLQVYKSDQSGYYNGYKWEINSNGFLASNEMKMSNQLLIIGDSFIENIMNPRNCNQSFLFSNEGFNVFEIGRSGITFIEALEFFKFYSKSVEPELTLIYVDEDDIRESIYENKQLTDRVQYSLNGNYIIPATIKYPILKKLLYNYKSLYYLYLGYLKSSNVEPFKPEAKSDLTSNNLHIPENSLEFLKIVVGKYDLQDVLFVFRTENRYRDFFLENGLDFLELEMYNKGFLRSDDAHWSCYGHKYAHDKVLSSLTQR